MRLWKVLDEDNRSCHGGSQVWEPGEWVEATGELVPCERGLHLCRRHDLVGWLGPAVWEAECDGETVEAADKVVCRRARVARRVEAWDGRAARLFAADCAERVLPVFEAAFPGDARPREAVEAARRFAAGEIGEEGLDAAWAAARAAAWAAAWDAAWAAAWDAARAAAWAAAKAAARAAARAAAWDAERPWQTDRLMRYLYPEEGAA